jgi:hypothetical protein
MSDKFRNQSGEQIVAETELLKVLIKYGNTVPSDGSTGYATGCLFLKTNGGVGSSLYVNEGSITSSDFNAK